jgi:hypothetical protein
LDANDDPFLALLSVDAKCLFFAPIAELGTHAGFVCCKKQENVLDL